MWLCKPYTMHDLSMGHKSCIVRQVSFGNVWLFDKATAKGARLTMHGPVRRSLDPSPRLAHVRLTLSTLLDRGLSSSADEYIGAYGARGHVRRTGRLN